MNNINEIFFDNHGLTSTSASHLADLAQEVIAGNEAKLKNMTFLTTKVDIVGSPSESGKTICVGYDGNMLDQVRPLLEDIAAMNVFCAWMREAVKAKDKELKRVANFTFEEWCTLQGFEIPSSPSYPQNEREPNKMKSAIKKQVEKQTLENTHRFKQELESEKQCYMAFFTQYKEWQLKEQERISKLKINVPEALQETYDRLSRLEE